MSYVFSDGHTTSQSGHAAEGDLADSHDEWSARIRTGVQVGEIFIYSSFRTWYKTIFIQVAWLAGCWVGRRKSPLGAHLGSISC